MVPDVIVVDGVIVPEAITVLNVESLATVILNVPIGLICLVDTTLEKVMVPG
jgi:hypothetical protein